MFTRHKLPLTIAFVVLIGLAFGAGCKGFFMNPALTSIAISPTSPQVQAGTQTTLQAFGTFDDGTRQQIRSGLSWASSDPSVATIDLNSGVLKGIQPGTTTVTADAQGLEGTATATVLLTNVTSITVSPTSGSVNVGGAGQLFTFTAMANGTPIQITTDSGAALTINPSTSDVTCVVSGTQELCSADSVAQTGQYKITMTYPGSSASATATLNVNSSQ